ncbi:MAG: hypothetical protein BWY57_01650 [Betaproteobacteria bacterium ADurb.Bin341]|jgi:hypothetical protein|nr:MAG: hypothetical protein BWY57_01650 [Betaproteobacteria bacterium ADurb.Bin341]
MTGKREINGQKLTLTILGLATTILLFAFGSLESRKVDKSAFQVHLENQREQFRRIESSQSRIEEKIDQLILSQQATKKPSP